MWREGPYMCDWSKGASGKSVQCGTNVTRGNHYELNITKRTRKAEETKERNE